ncbi:carboxylate--amine ligase [Dermabacteraceae bacterium P13147]
MSVTAPQQLRERFTPVVVGGDIGAYSLARAFHEAYGIKTVVVSKLQGWHVSDSAIIENVSCPDPFSADALLPVLRELENTRPGKFLLLGSADATVKAIIGAREGLSERWLAPYVDMETFRAGTEKQNFTRLCQDLGVDHPATVVVDLGSDEPLPESVPFAFPVIAKPAEVSEWKRADFPGKQKVHTVASLPELRQLLTTIRGAGYRESIIVQDMIPGDDQNMRILTCYCDEKSRVRFASYGRTLLEEHSPGAIGNPAAIVTDVNPEVVAQAQKLVSALGWTGYANFDLKYDPRDGKTKFFELNPRLGRSNYYVTAGGNNPVTYYVRELIEGTLEDSDSLLQEQEVALYTVVPVALVKHYTTLPDAKRQLAAARKNVKNPLIYRGVEKSPKRWAYIALAMANYVKKFRRYYRPQPDAGEHGNA